jgi:O-antigen/teichoic acid export membrane protein
VQSPGDASVPDVSQAFPAPEDVVDPPGIADDGGESVGRRTLRGMFWAYSSYVGGKLLGLVALAILARLLSVKDFGLVALALTFMTFLDTIKDLGLGQALIVGRPEELESRAQTVFSWTIVMGAVLSALTALGSPFVARFFHEGSALAALISVLGLNFFVRSLGATHYALARKELDYRTRTFAEVSDVLTRGIVSIALALAGFGAWSLVIGYLVGSSALAVTVWRLVPFRPRLRLSREHLGSLLSFGGTLTLVDIGAAFAHEMDYWFVGRVLGATALGYYSIGFRLPELLIINLAVVAGNVLFPAYALLDHERLRDAFLLSLRSTALIIFPLAVGLGVMARPVTLAFFGSGPKWVPSIDVMHVLVVYAVVVTLNIPGGTVLKATGQAWVLFALTVPYVISQFTALYIFADRGIVAVALCMAGMQALFLGLTWNVAGRRIGVRVRHSAKVLAVPLVAALTMGAALYPIERFVTSPWLALVAGTVTGIAVYGGLVWLLARDTVLRLRNAARA